MELKDLVGKHKLSGVDYMPSTKEDKYCDYSNDILFRLDDITYLMTEDEADGYRSYMTELEITDRYIKNIFPGQEVICEYIDNVNNYSESDILQISSLDGKLILEIGTDNTDDYYPFAVFRYYPENMDINKNIY